mgnify:CR=1 FL=1
MRKSPYIFLLIPLLSFTALGNDICQILSGAKIIAQDDKNTYLGRLANSYDSDSILNEYGTYGGEYNALSVFNEYGEFGSEYNQYSATNSYSSEPPMIIKDRKIIGYLSANKSVQSSISPSLVKALCAGEL